MALYSNTLADIRQYLAMLVADLIMGTADSGSSTTLVDTMLRKADDYYNNNRYRCYIYGGTNVGEERECSDWAQSSHQLTLDPAFTAAIDSTSKYELHCKFWADEYLKAINMAIEFAARNKYLVDIKDETTITLVADTYEYALPTTMLYIWRIITEEEKDGGVFEKAGEIDQRDWDIIKAYPPKLKLDEARYSVTAGKDLRLEGQGTQPTVDDDTDNIYLPPDWLVYKALTFLPLAKIESNHLDNVYKQALALSSMVPRTWPHPKAKAVVE